MSIVKIISIIIVSILLSFIFPLFHSRFINLEIFLFCWILLSFILSYLVSKKEIKILSRNISIGLLFIVLVFHFGEYIAELLQKYIFICSVSSAKDMDCMVPFLYSDFIGYLLAIIILEIVFIFLNKKFK